MDVIRAVFVVQHGALRATYDISQDAEMQNILTNRGFLMAVQLLRRVREHGLVFMGVPCSTWVFMNLGTSKCASWWLHKRLAQVCAVCEHGLSNICFER